MKPVQLLFAIMILSLPALAQKVAVSSLKQNVVEVGIANPLQIMGENASCNSLVVNTDNGSISRTGPCQYSYKPIRLGLAQIIVYAHGPKSGTNYLLRVVAGEKAVPTGTVTIGGLANGFIAKTNLQAQQGVALRSTEGAVPIHSYQLQLIRNGDVVFRHYAKGNRFGNEIYSAFAKAQYGDLLLIYDIYGESKKGEAFMVPPMQLIIR